jgi:formylglycine-generating enzyme required for sulfatase activity
MNRYLRIMCVVLLAVGIMNVKGDCPTADINGDCEVNLEDFTMIASQWLTIGMPAPIPDGILWVYVNDPGVSGQESFSGFMSKYETTNAQYCEFLNAALSTGDIVVEGSDVLGADGANPGADFAGQYYYYLEGSGNGYEQAEAGGAARINFSSGFFTVDPGFNDHPVTYVSWYGAKAFCNFYGWRLPTEWEWQAVADYDGSYSYGCGPEINNEIANYGGSLHPDGTSPVGSFGEYGYGMCDMAGNVFEWTESVFAGSRRVFRGGSWYYSGTYCPVEYRSETEPHEVLDSTGFRICY